ncbi:hypothetical protein DMUE_2755 [Dictyocoela muelleri]|nr:hypothetical protein DMUE_2755 [Dictyocoela muelleri]
MITSLYFLANLDSICIPLRNRYSPKNTKWYVNAANSKGINISLLCDENIQRVFTYKIKVGSFKASDLNAFIIDDLPILSQNEMKYIVIDNASIHKTIEFRETYFQKIIS